MKKKSSQNILQPLDRLIITFQNAEQDKLNNFKLYMHINGRHQIEQRTVIPDTLVGKFSLSDVTKYAIFSL